MLATRATLEKFIRALIVSCSPRAAYHVARLRSRHLDRGSLWILEQREPVIAQHEKG